MEDSNGDAPEKNIFGESVNKANEPHEANIFEQAAAERGKEPEVPQEANIFEQAAAESELESITTPESEPEPVVESTPEPEPTPEQAPESEPTPTQDATPTVEVPVAQALPAETPTPKKKKSKKWLIILIIILLVAATGAAVFFIFFNKGEAKAAEHDKKEPIPEAFTTVAKLNMDFEAGQITADEYFQQLTYSEYDSSKLDEKYAPDEAAVAPINNVDELLEFYEKYESEISKTSIENFANHYFLNDVALWTDEDDPVSATGIVLADKKENYAHRLDKVILSDNGHFLIWYTKEGDDAITDAQAKNLAANLEKNISKYSELTGSPYEFYPIDTEEGDTTSDARKVNKTLRANNIDTAYLLGAMNVYVMDTKSKSTLASYYSMTCDSSSDSGCAASTTFHKLINDFGQFNQSITWPHIVVNNLVYEKDDGGVSGEQTINHELFHHYQKIICSPENKKRYGYCPDNQYDYAEALANLASALVTNKKGELLGNWSWRYGARAHDGLRHITNDSGDHGYGQYPYFYSYQKIVNNGFATLVQAHKQSDPYDFIQKHTSASDMQKVINDAAYRAISGDYDNPSLKQDRGTVTFENDGDYSLDLDYEIMDGATMYFTLGKDWKLEFSGKDKISALIIKKKGDKWSIEDTAVGKLVKNSADYSDFDEIYLVVTNADLLNKSSFQLKFELADAPGTLTFNHKYNNYAVDLTMDMEMSGFNVHAVGKGVVDERHQREYLQTNMTTVMNMEISMITYSDFYNGIDYVSNPISGLGGGLGDIVSLLGGGEEMPTWTKTKTASHTLDIDFVVKRMMKSDEAKKVGDGHYKLKMTAAELADLMSTANNSSEDADYKVLNGDVEVDVYIDSYGRISKLDYDFSGLVSGIDKFTCSMVLSKYNEAGDVMIPPSIKANAQEAK